MKTILPTILISILSLLMSACATTGEAGGEVTEKQTSKDQELPQGDPFELAKLADEAYARSQWLESQRYYKTLTQIVPDDAYGWFRMANTHIRQGEITQAVHAYEEALHRDPRYPKAWYNLATAYLLNAQNALRQSYQNLREEDPGRALALQRIHALDQIIYQRLEESDSPVAAVGIK